MKSVYDYLTESPRKMKGDAPFSEFSEYVLKEKSKKVLDLYHSDTGFRYRGMSLYKSDKSQTYIMGFFAEDDRLSVVNETTLVETKYTSDTKLLKGKKLVAIDTVHTSLYWRGEGVSGSMYRYILDQGYTIISDSLQYEGAVNLWKGFLRMQDVVVYIYDIQEDVIISKASPNTPESHIWSTNSDKERIRLVLVKK